MSFLLSEIQLLLPPLLAGARITLLATLLSAAVALFFAFLAGLIRVGPPSPLRAITVGYVEVFRGTSLTVQLFYLFFVLPYLGVALPPLTTGVVALGLNFGAYGSEVVRSAINAVPRGQWEAALVLNMNAAKTMRRIIIPQAFLAMLPPFGNLLIELLKATSILSFIQITDLTFAGVMLYQSTAKSIPIYTLILVMYFVMAYPMTLCIRWFERRASVGFMPGRPN